MGGRAISSSDRASGPEGQNSLGKAAFDSRGPACNGGPGTWGVWQYEDDQPGSGNWRDCGVYLSGRLELHFNDSSLPRLYEWINGVRYAFDFASMTQTNTGTSFQRALRRCPSSGGGAPSSGGATPWEYEDGRPNSGDWRPCDAATSAFLAARLASGVSGPSAPRVIRGAQYTFDTQNFLQTNISTGFTRTIRPGRRRFRGAAGAAAEETG